MNIQSIKSIAMDQDKKMNRARIFWKSLTVLFFLTTLTGTIAWKTESYGRSMDAKVIRLETEKALRDSQSNATPTSTIQSTLPTTHVQKASVSLGK